MAAIAVPGLPADTFKHEGSRLFQRDAAKEQLHKERNSRILTTPHPDRPGKHLDGDHGIALKAGLRDRQADRL